MAKNTKTAAKQSARQKPASSRKSSRQRARSSDQPWPVFRPRTKAEWLQVEVHPAKLTFPLDPEVEAAIPKDLPGEVPSNETELYAEPPKEDPPLPPDCQELWNRKQEADRKWRKSLGLPRFGPLTRRVK